MRLIIIFILSLALIGCSRNDVTSLIKQPLKLKQAYVECQQMTVHDKHCMAVNQAVAFLNQYVPKLQQDPQAVGELILINQQRCAGIKYVLEAQDDSDEENAIPPCELASRLVSLVGLTSPA